MSVTATTVGASRRNAFQFPLLHRPSMPCRRTRRGRRGGRWGNPPGQRGGDNAPEAFFFRDEVRLRRMCRVRKKAGASRPDARKISCAEGDACERKNGGIAPHREEVLLRRTRRIRSENRGSCEPAWGSSHPPHAPSTKNRGSCAQS